MTSPSNTSVSKVRKSWYSEARRHNRACLGTAVHIYDLMPVYGGTRMTSFQKTFQEKPEPDTTSWCAQRRKKCVQFEGLCQHIRLELGVPPQPRQGPGPGCCQESLAAAGGCSSVAGCMEEASSCLAVVLAQTAVSLLLQKKGGELDESICR